MIATGLRFPEGPIAMPDGSVLVVEIAGGRLTRVRAARRQAAVVAELGGGPNGAALGPRRPLLRLQQRRLQLAHR